MYILSFILISIIATLLFLFFGQYQVQGEIIYWSIPLLLIAFFLAAIIFWLIIIIIIALIVPANKKQDGRPNKVFHYIVPALASFICEIFGLDIDLKGIEKLPEDKQYLLVSNHQSNLDPISTVSIFYKHRLGYLTYIMKDAILKIPVVGHILLKAGFLAIDRKNNRKAVETIILAAKKIEKGHHSIGLYPEGTRSAGPEMIKFRNGAFKIAQKAKCPIAVLIIDNGYRVKRRFPWRRTKILLEVIEVIEYEQYKDMNTNEIGAIVHQKMEEKLNVRRKELQYLK